MADAKTAVIEKEIDEGEDASSEPQSTGKLFTLPPLKFLIIGGAAFVLLAGGGSGAYFYLSSKNTAKAKEEAQTVKTAVFVDLPEVMVNLSTASTERTQYLKIKIVLELPNQKMIEQIQPIMPRVMDAFQTYLRELRPSDLDGSAGLYRLKEELTRRVNASIAPSRINAVLFKEIVVQ
jgi:flagellar protein FliL